MVKGRHSAGPALGDYPPDFMLPFAPSRTDERLAATFAPSTGLYVTLPPCHSQCEDAPRSLSCVSRPAFRNSSVGYLNLPCWPRDPEPSLPNTLISIKPPGQAPQGNHISRVHWTSKVLRIPCELVIYGRLLSLGVSLAQHAVFLRSRPRPSLSLSW